MVCYNRLAAEAFLWRRKVRPPPLDGEGAEHPAKIHPEKRPSPGDPEKSLLAAHDAALQNPLSVYPSENWTSWR